MEETTTKAKGLVSVPTVQWIDWMERMGPRVLVDLAWRWMDGAFK